MQQLRHLLIQLLLSFLLFACTLTGKTQELNPNYNKPLADSLGGDENGMKQYVLVILKTGSNDVKEKSIRENLFRGHMNNINKLAKEGKLIVAGPLQKNDKTYRGIFILNVKTIEEAKVLVDTDPAIKEKMLDGEFYVWYGSAALPMYLQFHNEVEKKKF